MAVYVDACRRLFFLLVVCLFAVALVAGVKVGIACMVADALVLVVWLLAHALGLRWGELNANGYERMAAVASEWPAVLDQLPSDHVARGFFCARDLHVSERLAARWSQHAKINDDRRSASQRQREATTKLSALAVARGLKTDKE
ncbi:MAG TPA: hypothetical protein VF284_12345 [Rhodanobacteraceae bacterium]